MRAMSALLLVLAAAVGGCATSRLNLLAADKPAPVQYECRENPPWHGTQSKLIATVDAGAGASQLHLSMAGGQSNVLTPFGDKSGQLFANADYAWRFNGTHALLTDVSNIRTYSCEPLPPAVQ
jgi:hypothetical protein